ncbi:hypothetical protein AB6A40_003227 [Gnathostoma spinigerum]|uniref:CTCK domain-containing protein n=1 Tax=Gnathostoma spinigerum TaxID=75299 RepID=A0ABD6E923_9BILA
MNSAKSFKIQVTRTLIAFEHAPTISYCNCGHSTHSEHSQYSEYLGHSEPSEKSRSSQHSECAQVSRYLGQYISQKSIPCRRHIRSKTERPMIVPLFTSFCFSVSFLFFCLLLSFSDARPSHEVDEVRPAGYVQYSVDNETSFEEYSRNAFMSLQSETVVDKLPLEKEHKKANLLQRKGRKHEKLERRGKRPLQGARKALAQALLNLGRADSVKHPNQCEGQHFKQRIRMQGCLSKVVTNKFCHGSCSSYYIPRLRTPKLKALFQSCSACQPSEYTWKEVYLECPEQEPSMQVRKVMTVKKCSCKPVNTDELSEEDV